LKINDAVMGAVLLILAAAQAAFVGEPEKGNLLKNLQKNLKL